MKKNNENNNVGESQKKNFLVFSIEENFFAIPLVAVFEIIDSLVCTPLPFVPEYIDGLINIKGKVIPQLNLQQLLFKNKIPNELNHGELLIIETSRSPCGLKIDKLIANVNIDDKSFKPINNKMIVQYEESSWNDCIIGEFEWQGKVVLVFSPNFFGELIDKKENTAGRQGMLGKVEDQDKSKKINTLDCLVVHVGKEKYALPLQDIIEIIQIDSITGMPGSPDEIKGIAMVRDQALLVLSLLSLLGRDISEEKARDIVIVECNGINYGLEIDEVEGIYCFDQEALQNVEDEDAELSGVLVTDDRSIIGLIKPEKIISDKKQKLFSSFVPERCKETIVEESVFKSVLQVTIGDEDYGIPLEDIKRITEYKKPEPVVTEDNDLIIGAVDINGAIVPVVDIAADHKTPESVKTTTEYTSCTSLASGFVIVGDDTKQWAVMIENAKEIINLPVQSIEKVTNSDLSFVVGVANIGEQLISVIDIDLAFNEA